MRYDVFISYSHTGDELLSERVQAGLQRFAKPWWRRRALHVFRDRTGLSANPGLWSSIAEAIGDSRYFLMLASPEAATSPWVAREVAEWRAKRGSQGLLVLLTDGEIAWDDRTNEFDWDATTALAVSAFTGCFAEEPRHVDMRWARSEVQLDLTDGRFRDQIAELAAPVHGIGKDELAGADVRQHRRTLRHAFAAGVALLVLTLAAFATSAFAVNAASAARRSERRAIEQQQRADTEANLASIERADAEHQKQVADHNAEQAQTSALDAERERRSADSNALVAVHQKHLADLNAQQAQANAQQAQQNAAQAQANLTLAVTAQGEVAGKNEQLLTANGQLLTVNGQLSTVNGQLQSTDKRLRQTNDALTVQRDEASRQRDVALSEALAASAGNAFDAGRFDLGLLLSVEGSRISPSARTSGSLLSGLRLQPTLVGHLQGLAGAVEWVAFSPDGRLLAAAGMDGTVDVWDVQTRARVAQRRPAIPCDVGGVVTFSANSQLLASSTLCGGDIELWNPRTGAVLRLLHPINPVTTLHFDRTGTLLATGGVQATIWDVNTGEVVHTLSTSAPGTVCLQPTISPDDAVVACAGGESQFFGAPEDAVTMQFWSALTGLPLGPPSVAYPGDKHSLFSVTFSADSKVLTTVASGSGVRPIIQWDVTTGQPTGAPFGPLLANGDSAVGISPDFAQIVSENATDQSLSLRDAVTGLSSSAPLHIPLDPSFSQGAVAFSPDGRTLAAGGADGPVRLWQSNAPTRLAASTPISVATDDFVTLSPGGRIAEVTHSGSSMLVDIVSGRPLTHQPPFTSPTSGGYSAFSGDGRTFVWLDSDNKIRRWNVARGQLEGSAVREPADCSFLIAVAFDGQTAALACGFAGDVKVIDLDSGRTISDLHTNSFPVLNAAFSRDGQLLAVGGPNAQIWDVSSSSLLPNQPERGQGANPSNLAFSPDGRTLAAAGALGSPVVFWDVVTGQLRQASPQGFGAGSVSNAIVVFAPDGHTVATGAMDGAVRLWDVASAQPIGLPFTRLPIINGQVQGNSAAVWALAFTADGQSLISATIGDSNAGTTGPNEIVRWDLGLAAWRQQACAIANRNLTTAEWQQFVGPGIAYQRICDGLP